MSTRPLHRDYSTKRWRRAAVITPGLGKALLVASFIEAGSERASYEAASSLRRAKQHARRELGVPLHWQPQDGCLVGYYLARHERRRPLRLFDPAAS